MLDTPTKDKGTRARLALPTVSPLRRRRRRDCAAESHEATQRAGGAKAPLRHLVRLCGLPWRDADPVRVAGLHASRDHSVQGSTFTAEAFAGKLAATGLAISMDGRGRFMDNIFIERLWRSIKYEEVHLKAYTDGCEARSGISSWMNFYNFRVLTRR